MSDSEVLRIKIVVEFLKFDTGKGIWTYFETHCLSLFSKMVDRSNFARQAANLHVLKRIIQNKMAKDLGAFSDSLHIIDGLTHTCL